MYEQLRCSMEGICDGESYTLTYLEHNSSPLRSPLSFGKKIIFLKNNFIDETIHTYLHIYVRTHKSLNLLSKQRKSANKYLHKHTRTQTNRQDHYIYEDTTPLNFLLQFIRLMSQVPITAEPAVLESISVVDGTEVNEAPNCVSLLTEEVAPVIKAPQNINSEEMIVVVPPSPVSEEKEDTSDESKPPFEKIMEEEREEVVAVVNKAVTPSTIVNEDEEGKADVQQPPATDEVETMTTTEAEEISQAQIADAETPKASAQGKVEVATSKEAETDADSKVYEDIIGEETIATTVDDETSFNCRKRSRSESGAGELLLDSANYNGVSGAAVQKSDTEVNLKEVDYAGASTTESEPVEQMLSSVE